jgi:hypothetical protein
VDCHITITKETSKQGLIDIDAFDLVHMHFEGLSVEKTVDVNYRRSVTAISVVQRFHQA